MPSATTTMAVARRKELLLLRILAPSWSALPLSAWIDCPMYSCRPPRFLRDKKANP